ncbi:MAG: electron transfer flavoprotein subunit beta/FixA family protein [Anaerolineae bacterium]|nr:electron transfer flavoprotein subunit beta/FixA family protein [Anaerolineae bacterium]
MNIITLIKQVPDISQLSSTVDAITLMNKGEAKVVNPWDEYALEASIRLKETHGGKVTVLSVGKPTAIEALKTGLAMGADEAMLISDPVLEGGDSLSTARVLAAAINKVGDYDLIVAGRSAVDDNMSATAIQVAALLDIPPLAYVAAITKIDPIAKTITVRRLTEGGYETVSSKLPAVLSVVKEINQPRLPSFMGIRKAAKAAIPTWGLADLGLEAGQVGAAGARVTWEVSLTPVREAAVETIAGSPADAARVLVDKLLAEKVI